MPHFERFVLAQILEYFVRSRDMLLLSGFIEFDIDVIELEIIGVNGHKSHRLLPFDFIHQEPHGHFLVNFDWEEIFFTRKEAEYGGHLWWWLSGFLGRLSRGTLCRALFFGRGNRAGVY